MSKRQKNIVILGSTGTIGINTLKVIHENRDKFNVVGLTAFNNATLLKKQIKDFSPTHVAVRQKEIAALKKDLPGKRVKIFDVESDLSELVTLASVDIVVIGMSGRGALEPFLAAVKAGKIVAPANKEALVIAGDLIMKEAKKHRATVIPIDSEQSAIFQCLQGQNVQELDKVYLTASGGALHNVPESRFDKLKVDEILKHPRWRMGKKITVDSATLMNKGFEVIEAKWLFGLDVKDIEVVVHPQAIIHSMVGFKDGSILAQLSITDMRLPIQYALTYPERWPCPLKKLDFFKLKELTFFRPNLKKFPALSLAINVAKKGGTFPTVLNAADEEAVAAFLVGSIKFTDIYATVEKVISKHKSLSSPKLKDIQEADDWARIESEKILSRLSSKARK